MKICFFHRQLLLCAGTRSTNIHRGRKIFGCAWLALLTGVFVLTAPAMLMAAGTSVTNVLSGQAAVLDIDTNSANSITLTTNAFNTLDDTYHLAIGDRISFQILEDEDPPVQLVVQDSGNIQVPYIGLYPAVGKTCKQLALALKKELQKNYYYRATVIISVIAKPKSRGTIYIVGAVHKPGPQNIPSDEELTVSKAIMRAGGLTDYANGKKVRVTRGSDKDPGGKQTFTVNVTAVLEQGKTEEDRPVKPGDLIFVPQRLIRF